MEECPTILVFIALTKLDINATNFKSTFFLNKSDEIPKTASPAPNVSIDLPQSLEE